MLIVQEISRRTCGISQPAEDTAYPTYNGEYNLFYQKLYGAGFALTTPHVLILTESRIALGKGVLYMFYEQNLTFFLRSELPFVVLTLRMD